MSTEWKSQQEEAKDQEGIRNWLLHQVFAAICAILSIVRSQKANNFQVVMGLFLLGSGAAKREIAVFAQAGLSVNYSSVIEHIKTLSAENLSTVQQVVKKFMCSIAWDNINFAFRVESQHLTSKDHFDSGTTSTLIIQHDPDTNTPATHGALSLDMKPPRTTTKQNICDHSLLLLPSVEHAQKLDDCSLWQLKQLPSCPSIEKITPHTTQQYPLPAMHKDESSIDGTINVESARRNSTGSIEGMKTTIRRFGLFHCKMSEARMEHTNLLGWTPMSVGWQTKKSAPWKQSHKLLQMSLVAHVLDGFRIHCGHQHFDKLALEALMEEFNTVAKKVYQSLFTTAAFEEESEATDPDIVFMNNILYNRDVLYYWLLVKSIKSGDIGQVILVLRVWMVMILLGDCKGEIKVIYNAKGVNRSWEWLSMISTSFDIPIYGSKHTIPDMTEIKKSIPSKISFWKAQIWDDEDEGDDEEYQPTPEDLEMDEEEPISMADELVDMAISIMDS
ncbi:hypothetical protein K435DRAFT_797792 [Dendrothele bispora CBS 962.96]|uniref:DUF6589 domain-containing protein n=1 Tax=Dendrothele bispora (strain CBS 962.96) TaxID=1314807 RepID=A0A4S8M2F4_DENBC|nr:hypothetical protein K435DRAFT_797792 [Dendrothele bispora CBS 962.96]